MLIYNKGSQNKSDIIICKIWVSYVTIEEKIFMDEKYERT